MENLVFYTDPHLGRTMQAHTTQASRKRLAESIFQTARGITQMPGIKICAGDLFDKFQNNEETILMGGEIALRTRYTMAGNHDLTADASKIGSLQLLRTMMAEMGADILITEFGKAECFLKSLEDVDLLFIPHHTTDDLFQQSLNDALAWAPSKAAGRTAYLLLHCNYDSGFAVDETALSMTRKQAKDLLDAGIDYIVIGHDHHPREDWDGRVIILGNTHPTGFGDITAKRVLVRKPDGSHEFQAVWSPEDKYRLLKADELIDGKVDVTQGVDFIEIEGVVRADQVMPLAREIRRLWNDVQPMAIRNKVEIEKVHGEGTVNHDFASLDQVILEDLKDDPELRELFTSYWNRTAPAVEEA